MFTLDIGDGPFADALWSFNYFFYNEEARKVCFFFCKAEIMAINDSMEMCEEDDEGSDASQSQYEVDMSQSSESD